MGKTMSSQNDLTAQYANTHILVVDDVSLTPMALAKTLRKFGCRLDSAKNGNEALEKLKRQEYDLVFMDCYMPEMNGFEATYAIRAGDSGVKGKPVIIALTGDTMNTDREKCLKAGMNDFLSKPFTPDQVSHILQKWAQ